MTAESLDELRVLRMRAYGPAADIDEDPDAMRRLEELEARRSPSAAASSEAEVIEPVGTAPAVNGGPASAPLRAPAPLAAPASLPAAPGVAPHEHTPEVIAAPPWRLAPGFAVLWSFTIVAAALIAASITWTVAYLAPVSVSSGAEQVARLTPSDDIDIPVGWFGAGESSRTWEYLGVVLFETTYGMTGSGGDRCLSIVTADQLPGPEADPNNWSVSGGYWSGCGLGVFPTTVEVRIDSSVPDEMRSEFADGSVLQFVLDGDKVGVFLDPAD